ncbi:MAG TPA: nucleoside hydrolase, partial [Pelolinea sp.]|nr:nucleoside hydrolase [Pelolinea sp.]
MKKIWIDTDPGVDDAVAIAMLLEAKDKIQFVGASTVFGNVDVDQTTRNARLLFQAGGLGDLPIARGASGPLGILRETAPYVHGDNGLGNMELAEPTMPV